MATAPSPSLHPPSSPSPPPSPSPSTPTTTIHIGTRRSALALAQTSIVQTALQSLHPRLGIEIHSMATLGDKNQTTALHAFDAKSLWTHELETLLLAGQLDLVVHSLKDMPTQLPRGCALGCVLARADPRDVVLMHPALAARGVRALAQLPAGAVVGTSSVRRGAQVARAYPGLVCADVRGNVGTRVGKLDGADPARGGYSCLILAAAGVERLGMGARVSGYLGGRGGEGGWMGAVGQGALGVECREGDGRVEALLRGLGHRRSWLECLAERSLLRTLEGGCSVPIGVETKWEEEEGRTEEEEEDEGEGGGGGGMLFMKALVLSVDGTEAVEGQRRQRVRNSQEADQCGWEMAQELVRKGAGRILEKITLNRAVIEKQDGA